MATPTFRAAGTAVFTANNVANPTNLSPVKNAATVNGDCMVLVTESRSITATVSTPSGWTLVSGFPKTSATASGGRIYIFVRIADGTASDAPTVTWTGLTTGTTGDSAGARILSFQNTTTTADGTPPAANDASSTTSITIPAHTTALPNSLVVGVAIRINDTAHTFTVATFTERSDDHTTTGTGHGTETSSVVNTSAGSSGTATVTPSNTTASRTLAVSFGLACTANVVTLNQVTETDLAQPITERKTKTIGQTTETDTAQAVTPLRSRIVSVVQASETDTAQPIAWAPKRRIVNQTTETDTAQPLTKRKTVTLGQTTETDLAQTMTPVLSGGGLSATVNQVGETDLAQALTRQKVKAVGQATETDTAQPITWAPKRRLLAQVLETDFAQAMTLVFGGVVAAVDDWIIRTRRKVRRR